jgi:hypothetical protein
MVTVKSAIAAAYPRGRGVLLVDLNGVPGGGQKLANRADLVNLLLGATRTLPPLYTIKYIYIYRL